MHEQDETPPQLQPPSAPPRPLPEAFDELLDRLSLDAERRRALRAQMHD